MKTERQQARGVAGVVPRVWDVAPIPKLSEPYYSVRFQFENAEGVG
jgi:hypothetical protein